MTPEGFRLLPARLDQTAQQALLDDVLTLCEAAPPYRAVTPGGALDGPIQ